jgi:glycerol-3-phosphate dehydrogenase
MVMMERKINELSKEKFDVIVIGGGVIGTGVARDAALRGLKTLLLEKDDFGYGTTSRSTRLIHGGLRYLSHFDFKLVRQDLREREVLLKIAPHLVKPLPFLLPLTGLTQHFIMGTGMKLYDMLSYDKSVPTYKHFSRQQTLEIEPQLKLKDLRGAYKFYDCQVAFPERLSLENAISAFDNGAAIINHAEVTGISSSGRTVQGVRVKDRFLPVVVDVSGRIVVNVTGHWTNGILQMAAAHPKNEIRTTKGVHLVTPKLSNNAIVLFSHSDGRLIFVIPWHGYSLIGTTDTEYSGDKEIISAEVADVSYLVNEVQHAFPELSNEDVYYTFAGLRSLVSSGGKKVSNISRSHKLVDHETEEGLKGIVSILGGKMTGYRSIAEEAVDLICRKLDVNVPCSTAEKALPGAPGLTPEALDKLAVDNSLPRATLDHLNSLYGSRTVKVLEIARTDPRGIEKICPHTQDILAQVWFAVKEESCLTATDFLLRRSTTGLCSCQGLDAVEVVAVEMGRLLGWSIGEWQRQVEIYRSVIAPWTFFRKSGTSNG